MATDEEAARTDVQKLQELLDRTTNKSKKQKEKAEEYRITFKNLEQFPYVMQQSAWQLEWDKVWALYDFHIGVPVFIIDDSIIAQWSPTASPSSSQWLTDSEDSDTLYTHAVLFSLMALNLLDTAQGREQGNYGNDPKRFVYSAVVIFVHPGQVLTTVQNTISFFQQQYDAILQGGHSNGWCTLCKLPHYKTSWFFPVVPRMPCLALPMSEPSMDPTVWSQLHLDTAGCDANHMIIWLLHHMRCHDTDYTMMPLALRSNLDVPWDLCMEEYPKLWQNSIYTTWKVGFPREEVGLALTFVSTSRRDFDSGQLVLDISDGTAIQYPALKVDDKDNSNESDFDAPEDNNDEDDSDDDYLDGDLPKMATEIANKTDDFSFCSSTEDNSKIEPLSSPGTTWTGKVQLYSLRVLAVSCSTQSGMHTASCSGEVSGASFDAFLNVHADGSSIGELMGGQALLRDYTRMAELKQLCELANEQIKIVHRFDTKFSDTVFTFLQKTQEAFIGTGGIAQRFVNNMATTGLNFIQDATTYEAELSASDGMAFVARLTRIWEQITELIREASALELMYKGAQKKFASILEQVGKDVKEYLDTQSMADCTTFMDESFKSLHKFLEAFNVSPFIPVVVGMTITHHSLLTSLQVNVLHIPLKIFLLPLMSSATAASGQMALLSYMAQQGVAMQERQAQSKPMLRTSPGEMDPTLKSDHGSSVGLVLQKLKLDKAGLMPSKKDRMEAQ